MKLWRRKQKCSKAEHNAVYIYESILERGKYIYI